MAMANKHTHTEREDNLKSGFNNKPIFDEPNF